MAEDNRDDWEDLGPADAFKAGPILPVRIGGLEAVVTFADGAFGALLAECPHFGASLAKGYLDGDQVSCPQHGWKFHHRTGLGRTPQTSTLSFEVSVRDGRLLARPKPRNLGENPNINQ